MFYLHNDVLGVLRVVVFLSFLEQIPGTALLDELF
jgi:hypothetical protein